MLSVGLRGEARDPMPSANHFPVFVVLLFALSFLLPMIFRIFSRSPRDKARVVVEYARKRGYALVNPALAEALDVSALGVLKNPAFRNSIKSSSDIADIEGLDNGTGEWFAFTCKLRSKEATIFNLNVSSKNFNTDPSGISYKVAKIEAAGLPRFSLGRNSVVNTIETAVDKVAGASKPTIHVDAQQYPEFSKQFWIRGADPAAVTAFLSADKIAFLENAKLKGTLATNTSYLVYFEPGKLVSEQDFDGFIADVEKLVANLL
jgi:hypothetical protein